MRLRRRPDESQSRKSGSARAALLLPLFLLAAITAYAESNLPKAHLNVVVSDHLTPGADAGEVAAVSEMLLKSIGLLQGLMVDSQIDITSAVETVRKRVDEKKMDILVSPALEYVTLERGNLLEPVMTMSASQSPKGKTRYLVLTSQDSNLSSLEALKDKTILTYTRSDQALLRMWVDVLLSSHHLPIGDKYFHTISGTFKPSTACLPVFFGKADGCVIDDATWGVLRELNPQLGSKLRPIAESPPLVETIIALHTARQQYRAEILRGMQSLPSSPSGRQLLFFFKSRNAYMISKEDLAEVFELRGAYLKIAGGGEKKTQHSRSSAVGAKPETGTEQ